MRFFTILMLLSMKAFSHDLSVEFLNVLNENTETFVEFKNIAEKVEFYKSEVHILNRKETEYFMHAYKMKQGDIIFGKAILKITKELIGENPEDYFYNYKSEIIHQ